MSDDREKLLKIMSSLEDDYRSGKISADKYSYFRSKYEDKLNTIDAKAATRRIRSMQGKPTNNSSKKKRRSRKPTVNKKKEEQDLVQKYIINPKKGDAKYNKTKKSSMDSGTFKLLLLLILVIGFTAGVAYGIFSFDFDELSNTDSVAIVQDTAFPEIKEVNVTSSNNYTFDSNYSSSTIETTTDDSSDSSDSQGGGGNTPDSGGDSDTPTPTPTN
ncbi:endoglucanase [Methanobrevibacter sp.]|uniref:endoglucanase n=1 Tax=Methanobrevibacter sp. TaxID=66852 RepID=UPI00387011D6